MSQQTNKSSLLALAFAFAFTPLRAAEPAASATSAEDDAADLAKKPSNPVAALISEPLQNNFDFGGGPNDDDGFRYILNVPPVGPFQMTGNWNLISRTIVPFLFPK